MRSTRLVNDLNFADDESLDWQFTWHMRRVWKTLRQYRHAHTALVSALLKKKTLPFDEAKAIFTRWRRVAILS